MIEQIVLCISNWRFQRLLVFEVSKHGVTFHEISEGRAYHKIQYDLDQQTCPIAFG